MSCTADGPCPLKIDLAPHVGADLDVMDRDSRKMRGERPFLFTHLKSAPGLDDVAQFILTAGGFEDTSGDAASHSAVAS